MVEQREKETVSLKIRGQDQSIDLYRPKIRRTYTISEARKVLPSDALKKIVDVFAKTLMRFYITRVNVLIEGLQTAEESGIKDQTEMEKRFERLGVAPTYTKDALVPPEVPPAVLDLAMSGLAGSTCDGTATTSSVEIYQSLIAWLIIRADYVKGLAIDQIASSREAGKAASALFKDKGINGTYSESRAILKGSMGVAPAGQETHFASTHEFMCGVMSLDILLMVISASKESFEHLRTTAQKHEKMIVETSVAMGLSARGAVFDKVEELMLKMPETSRENSSLVQKLMPYVTRPTIAKGPFGVKGSVYNIIWGQDEKAFLRETRFMNHVVALSSSNIKTEKLAEDYLKAVKKYRNTDTGLIMTLSSSEEVKSSSHALFKGYLEDLARVSREAGAGRPSGPGARATIRRRP